MNKFSSFCNGFFSSLPGKLYSLGGAITFFYVLWVSLPITGIIDLIIKLVLATVFGNFWPLYWVFKIFVR